MYMMGGPETAVAHKEVRYHLSLPTTYTCLILSFVFIFIAALKLSSNGIAYKCALLPWNSNTIKIFPLMSFGNDDES